MIYLKSLELDGMRKSQPKILYDGPLVLETFSDSHLTLCPALQLSLSSEGLKLYVKPKDDDLDAKYGATYAGILWD